MSVGTVNVRNPFFCNASRLRNMAVAASCKALPSPAQSAHFAEPLRHKKEICAEYSMLTKALISSRSRPACFAPEYHATGSGNDRRFMALERLAYQAVSAKAG